MIGTSGEEVATGTRYEMRTEVHYLEAGGAAAIIEHVDEWNGVPTVEDMKMTADVVVTFGIQEVVSEPKEGVLVWMKRIPPHRVQVVFVTVHEIEEEEGDDR